MNTQYIKQFYLTQSYNKTQDKDIFKRGTDIINPFSANYFLSGILNSSNILITHFELQAPPETKFKIFYYKNDTGEEEESVGIMNSLGILDWDLTNFGYIKKFQLLSVPSLKNISTITNFNSTILLTLWYQYN